MRTTRCGFEERTVSTKLFKVFSKGVNIHNGVIGEEEE